ncbi:hypothetical protein I4U23_021938 [Adineta vaga]|nr:hypothetical protein I4U23_021938 [Adineta vaga]
MNKNQQESEDYSEREIDFEYTQRNAQTPCAESFLQGRTMPSSSYGNDRTEKNSPQHKVQYEERKRKN